MEGLEEQYFAPEYAQDMPDISNDLKQPGATGVGLFDQQKSMKGYLYGYQMTPDEFEIDIDTPLEDLIEQYNAKFFVSVPDDFLKTVFHKMQAGQIFYVSNFVIDKNYRIGAFKMIKKLLEDLKNKGYQYITFDALSDTFRLFMNPDMTPKRDRLDKVGLELVAVIPLDEDRVQALIKL